MNTTVMTLQDRMEDLGLSFMAAGLESYLEQQARSEQTLAQTLQDLLDLELGPRKERAVRSRVKLSGLPALKKLEDFDQTWLKGGLTQRQFGELSSLSFIARKENIIFLGPSGLGKTHLMLALAHKACLNGYTAWYTTCNELMENMSRAREAGKLKRKLTWLRKPHVLVIDEVGYENLSREQANLFFQVVNARYENGPILITTNKTFGKWSEMMADDAIATATLDRLLHHAHILSLKGDSYRMKDRIKTGVVDPD
ncbi:IS21-like element helper ATPase IstB [Treponema sp.]